MEKNTIYCNSKTDTLVLHTNMLCKFQETIKYIFMNFKSTVWPYDTEADEQLEDGIGCLYCHCNDLQQ